MFKTDIVRDPSDFMDHFRVAQKLGENWYILKCTWEQINLGEVVKPTLSAEDVVLEEFLQSVVDAAYKYGITPKQSLGSKEHLEDMRKIVFKQLDIK